MKLLIPTKKQLRTTTSGRVCIFSHFDANDQLQEHVVNYLSDLKSCGFEIIFVSTSVQLQQSACDTLLDVCTIVCIRENLGYDFGSYKVGIDLLPRLDTAPSILLLANDSVYGPFAPLDQLIEFGSKNSIDIWGCTDSFEHQYHLQSYFLCFNGNSVNSHAFKEFWKDETIFRMDASEVKSYVIENYELKLARYFSANGFSVGAVYSFQDVYSVIHTSLEREMSSLKSQAIHLKEFELIPWTNSRFSLYSNPTHFYWKILNIHLKCPFIKKELLLKNPTNRNLHEIANWIGENNSLSALAAAKHLVAMGRHSLFYGIDPAEYCRTNPKFPAVNVALLRYEHLEALGLTKKAEYSFDEQRYLAAYPDVRDGVSLGTFASAYSHFLEKGLSEGRYFYSRLQDSHSLSSDLLSTISELADREKEVLQLKLDNGKLYETISELSKTVAHLEKHVRDLSESRAFKILSRIERIRANFR